MKYIYCYTNTKNDKKYVGQTGDIQRRRREHRNLALRDRPTSLFHKDLKFYGEDVFEFEVLEFGDWTQDHTNERETYWIQEKNSFYRTGHGYNLTRNGTWNGNEGNRAKLLLSESSLEKIRQEISEGISYDELNSRYGLSAPTASGINHGTLYHDPQRQYPLFRYYKEDSDYDELVDLLKNSYIPLTRLAERFNLGYSTVKKINQGTLRPGLSDSYPIRERRADAIRADIIKDLLKGGATSRQVMSETGCSAETVRRINLGITHFSEEENYPLRKPVSTMEGQSSSRGAIDTHSETDIGH